MDQWLAQVYGTGGSEDLEKTAQAMMLEKLAQNEGVDLNQFSPDELQALAAEVFTANGGQQVQQGQGQQSQAPQGQYSPEQIQQFQAFQEFQQQQLLEQQAQQYMSQQGQQGQGQAGQQELQQGGSEEMAVKEAQAKFEEADFLGRVMAHSYHQEMQKIATAGVPDAADAQLAHEMMGRKPLPNDPRFATHLGEHKPDIRNVLRQNAKAEAAGSLKSRIGELAGKGKGLAKQVGSHLGSNKGKYIAGAAGLAALGGGGAYLASGSKEKSAFDQLAEQRALQILAENGIDPNAQQVQQPQVDGQQFAQALEKKAYEMLGAAGYLR